MQRCSATSDYLSMYAHSTSPTCTIDRKCNISVLIRQSIIFLSTDTVTSIHQSLHAAHSQHIQPRQWIENADGSVIKRCTVQSSAGVVWAIRLRLYCINHEGRNIVFSEIEGSQFGQVLEEPTGNLVNVVSTKIKLFEISCPSKSLPVGKSSSIQKTPSCI